MVTHPCLYRNRFSAVVFCIGAGLLAAIAGAGISGTARADEYDGAVQKCEELLPEFDSKPTDLQHEVQGGTVDEPVGVRLSWKRSDTPPGGDPNGWIVCFFLPRSESGGAWQIDQMDTQKYGKMKRYDVQQLYKLRWLNQHYIPQLSPGPTTPPQPAVMWLYLLQQTLNGLTLGCLYALLAVGFTIVYGITRIVNLAFGDLYMVGAFVTYLCYVVIAAGGGSFAWPVLAITLLIGVGVCATAGWVTDKLAFRHMRRAATTVPMVASIGIALILRDVIRLSQGPKTRWMPPTPGTTWKMLEGYGFDVYLRKGHVMIGIATALVALAFWWAGRHTRFGRGYRAASQDPRMASLVGIDVNRTIGISFLIAGAMTGVAGVFAAMQYQIIDFYMGYLIGFKALTAALLGGIGSIPGAFVGGFVIAMVEIYAGMAFGYEWRDLAVFAVLAAVLIFRPGGLLATLRYTQADERV